MWNVLPTGRNYSVDPQAIPSPPAWETGRRLADALIERYCREHGRHPRTVGLVIWGTARVRTHGDDVAQALALLGVRPLWRPETGRVREVEAVPLADLGRPGWRHGAPRRLLPGRLPAPGRPPRPGRALVALDGEPEADNPVAAHVRGSPPPRGPRQPASSAASRGATGPGCCPDRLPALGDGGRPGPGLRGLGGLRLRRGPGRGAGQGRLRARFGAVEVALKNQDNREHDLFDSDDYFQYHGGMIAAVRAIRGPRRRVLRGQRRPRRPAVRSLHEEARRVFRTRVANPRWLAAMRATATRAPWSSRRPWTTSSATTPPPASPRTGCTRPWPGATPSIRSRSPRSGGNPWALHDVTARLLEAASRGMWAQPRPETLDALRRQYLSVEGDLSVAHPALVASPG